jgi:hypothetical protein
MRSPTCFFPVRAPSTRAKYFLFAPWIYLILEAKPTPTASIATKARKLETELITALKAADEAGVICGRAKENLQSRKSGIGILPNLKHFRILSLAFRKPKRDLMNSG